MSAAFQFGQFDYICQRAALTVCPLLGTAQGIMPTCYARNVQLGSQVIFQPATCFVHIAALGMTAIMLFHVRSKYTAVGRKEIVLFFYLYMIVSLLAIFLDSAIIPTANAVYPWFTGVYAGFIAATYWCLLVNGMVGFSFVEDGTPMSLWFLRLSSLVVGGVCFFVAIATFRNIGPFKYDNPIGLFVTYLIFPAVCVVIYVVSQLILVIRTLDDRWVIGDIIFGIAFYAIGVVLLFAFSLRICDAVSHYIDGVFFFTLAMLFAVMMVYKFWDSITKEDLEFSVGSKQGAWEVKEPLVQGNSEYFEDDSRSAYGAAGGSLVGGYGGGYYANNNNNANYTGPSQQYQQQYAGGGGFGNGQAQYGSHY